MLSVDESIDGWCVNGPKSQQFRGMGTKPGAQIMMIIGLQD